MAFAPRKPFGTAPLIDIGDSLSSGQVGWWLANEGVGSQLTNIADRNRFRGTLQSGATRQTSTIGNNIAMSGTTSYVDLGTAPLIAGTTPFTLHWLEYVGASPPTFASVATFMPSGNTQRFLLFHEDSDANYKNFSCGLGSAAATNKFATVPTLASGVGLWRQWILIGNAGMNGSTPSSFTIIVDGVYYGGAASGGGFSSQTSNLNYLGWDSADSQWKGAQDDFRLWNRVLSSKELDRLIANPYAGVRSRRVMFGSASLPLGNMLLAM